MSYTRGLKPQAHNGRRYLRDALGMHSVMTFKGMRPCIRMMKTVGLLPLVWKCPKCGHRLAAGRTGRQCKELECHFRRCNRRTCSMTRIHPIHGHPLFTIGRTATDLRLQFATLSSLLHRTCQADIHIQLGIPHATVERMHSRLREHLCRHVEAKQESFQYGPGYIDVEVDEVTLCKFPSGDARKPVAWISYLGMVQRGHPASLKLIPMPIKHTSAKAPGPGPIDLPTWQKIAEDHFVGSRVVIHTDSARAYRAPVAGCLQTLVVHQLKKVDGVWQLPKWSTCKRLDLPGGGSLRVRTGTQTIDGFWSHLRKGIGHCHRSDPKLVNQMVRETQFRYWNSGLDPVKALGQTMPKHL